jgi:hypothetical protein
MTSIAWMTLLIPIGESEPVSIVRGEPPHLSSILVSPSEADTRRGRADRDPPTRREPGMPRFAAALSPGQRRLR